MIKKIIGKIQNLMYEFSSKNFKSTQNKILMIGSYQKFGNLIRELKKDRKNMIIRGSTFLGRSLFRKDVDYYITFEDSEECIRKKINNFDIIITTNDISSFERKVINISNNFGIPSIIVQHGYPANIGIFQSIPILATKMAAWGKFTKDLLVEKGAEEEKIILTGSPQFDEYITRKKDKKEKILKKYNISLSTKKIILFTAQPFRYKVDENYDRLSLEEQKQIFDNLFDVTKELNLFLIIKLHPTNELSFEEISEFIPVKKYENNLILKHGQGDLFDIISICDISITYNSSTAIESMLLDKPVITVNFSNKKDTINYAQYECVIPVYDKNMLRDAIINLLNSDILKEKLRIKADRFLKNSFYKLDGLSSKRVADLIVDTIKN